MIKRRKLLSAAALTWLATASQLIHAQQRKIVVSGSGGVVADANKAIYYEPYAKTSGIAVEHVATEQQRMAQLEAMVRAGRTTWDAMEISASDYPLGLKKGLFEKIDYTKVDPKNSLPAMARQPYGAERTAAEQPRVCPHCRRCSHEPGLRGAALQGRSGSCLPQARPDQAAYRQILEDGR